MICWAVRPVSWLAWVMKRRPMEQRKRSHSHSSQLSGRVSSIHCSRHSIWFVFTGFLQVVSAFEVLVKHLDVRDVFGWKIVGEVFGNLDASE